MKKYISLSVVLVLLFASCGSDDSSPATGSDDMDEIPATAEYRITFTPSFTDTQFPTDYPANAMFSGMLVAVHDSANEVFGVGSLATVGMQALAEEGSNSALRGELEAMGGTDDVSFRVATNAAGSGPTSPQSVSIIIDPEKTRLSFVSKLSPSPDWFVGLDSYNLIVNGNELVEDVTINIGIFDAGTDSGTTYESADSPSSPVQTISVMADPPINNGGGLAPVLGAIRIERIDN